MNKKKDFLNISWVQTNEWVMAIVIFNKEELKIEFNSKFIGDDFDKFSEEFSKCICELFIISDYSLKKICKHFEEELGYVMKEELLYECTGPEVYA